MTTVFADSSFYVALLVKRDSNHAKAKSLARTWANNLVTTDAVLTEIANYLSSKSHQRARFGQLVADLEADPNTQIIETSGELWKRGCELYLRRPDKEWSLTDCISFVVMNEGGVAEALTADHHFEQAGFKALLAI